MSKYLCFKKITSEDSLAKNIVDEIAHFLHQKLNKLRQTKTNRKLKQKQLINNEMRHY